MIEKYIDETGEKKDLEKFANLTYLLDIWMNNIEKGTKIADFFKNRGYNSIGVYGKGILGRHLITQLNGSNVKVCFYIEQNEIEYELHRYSLRDIGNSVPVPDVIVVTPIMEYDSIKNSIKKIIDINIISIEEVILSI